MADDLSRWLALREAADFAARSHSLTTLLINRLGGARPGLLLLLLLPLAICLVGALYLERLVHRRRDRIRLLHRRRVGRRGRLRRRRRGRLRRALRRGRAI